MWDSERRKSKDLTQRARRKGGGKSEKATASTAETQRTQRKPCACAASARESSGLFRGAGRLLRARGRRRWRCRLQLCGRTAWSQGKRRRRTAWNLGTRRRVERGMWRRTERTVRVARANGDGRIRWRWRGDRIFGLADRSTGTGPDHRNSCGRRMRRRSEWMRRRSQWVRRRSRWARCQRGWVRCRSQWLRCRTRAQSLIPDQDSSPDYRAERAD